jgi:hypothetical protein
MAQPEQQPKDHDPGHDEDTEGQAVVALVLRQDCRQKERPSHGAGLVHRLMDPERGPSAGLRGCVGQQRVLGR